MKILITGGAGFIGSNIADTLLAKVHDVVVFDNLSSGKKKT
jgi:UDP-glucose 4-epimerase